MNETTARIQELQNEDNCMKWWTIPRSKSTSVISILS